MNCDVTLVAMKISHKLKYLKSKERKLKLQEKLLISSSRRSFQLGNKKFRVVIHNEQIYFGCGNSQ